MPLDSPKDALNAGEEAKTDLEAVKERIAALRARLTLGERYGDRDLIDQTKDQMERSLKPEASQSVRQAGDAAERLKAFRDARQPQSGNRMQLFSRDRNQ